jgi:hypothetical protein
VLLTRLCPCDKLNASCRSMCGTLAAGGLAARGGEREAGQREFAQFHPWSSSYNASSRLSPVFETVVTDEMKWCIEDRLDGVLYVTNASSLWGGAHSVSNSPSKATLPAMHIHGDIYSPQAAKSMTALLESGITNTMPHSHSCLLASPGGTEFNFYRETDFGVHLGPQNMNGVRTPHSVPLTTWDPAMTEHLRPKILDSVKSAPRASGSAREALSFYTLPSAREGVLFSLLKKSQ